MNDQMNVNPVMTGPGMPQNDQNPAWERRDEIGLGPALFETWKQSLTEPRMFFGSFNSQGKIGDAVIYLIIMAFVSSLSIFMPGFDSFMPTPEADVAPMMMSGFTKIVMIPLIPVIAVIGVVIMSGIFHLCLLLFGGVSKPFESTFKVVAYASGTTVFSLIPFIGSIIGSIWNIVLLSIGLSEVHRTDLWKAIVTVLIPFLLCSCCLVFGAMTTIMSIMAATAH